MSQVIWIFLVGIALTASAVFYARVMLVAHWQSLNAPLLFGCGAVLLIFPTYIFLKAYCTTWGNISKGSLVLLVYEHVLVPAMALLVPLLTLFHSVRIDGTVINKLTQGERLLMLVAFIVLMDITGFLRRTFNENWTLATGSESQGLSGAFTQNLFVRYPPQTRGDMWAIDVLVNGIWILLFFIHFA